MIVLMAGLPETGKTTLARELAHRTQGAIYQQVKAGFEPICYLKTTISTDQSLERCLEQAFAIVSIG